MRMGKIFWEETFLTKAGVNKFRTEMKKNLKNYQTFSSRNVILGFGREQFTSHTPSKKWPNYQIKKWLYLGYNWKRLSQQVRGKVQVRDKNVLAPAGSSMRVQQVVGYCGRSKVLTEVFKTKRTLSEDFENCTVTTELELIIKCDASYVEVNYL